MECTRSGKFLYYLIDTCSTRIINADPSVECILLLIANGTTRLPFPFLLLHTRFPRLNYRYIRATLNSNNDLRFANCSPQRNFESSFDSIFLFIVSWTVCKRRISSYLLRVKNLNARIFDIERTNISFFEHLFNLCDDTRAYNVLAYSILSCLIYDERLSSHLLNHSQPDRSQLQGYHFLHHVSRYNGIHSSKAE